MNEFFVPIVMPLLLCSAILFVIVELTLIRRKAGR